MSREQCMVPRIEVETVDALDYRATVVFGDYFLGLNGAAHGGAVTLVFDEVLGELSAGSGRPPSRTVYLNTTFHQIAPIGVELELVARVDRIEGRKRFISGELLHNGQTCARAEALFVELLQGQA